MNLLHKLWLFSKLVLAGGVLICLLNIQTYSQTAEESSSLFRIVSILEKQYLELKTAGVFKGSADAGVGRRYVIVRLEFTEEVDSIYNSKLFLIGDDGSRFPSDGLGDEEGKFCVMPDIILKREAEGFGGFCAMTEGGPVSLAYLITKQPAAAFVVPKSVPLNSLQFSYQERPGVRIHSFAHEDATNFTQEDFTANDESMKNWMEYMTPGPTHEMLAKGNGTWSAKITMWMMPDSEPIEAEGVMTNEMILGGRYQKSTYSGNIMGMPMEGMSLLAYDNAAKEFYNIWIDNMGTGMMMSKGKFDEGSNMADMKGTYIDPMTGKEEPFRQTMQIVDDNNQVMEMFMYIEGKEYKNMHIEYTRQ